MKTLILTLALLIGTSAQAAGDKVYTRSPGKVISKLEAMKILLLSDNKEVIYKCQVQKISDKGTVKNK